jgi:hypothetical protein
MIIGSDPPSLSPEESRKLDRLSLTEVRHPKNAFVEFAEALGRNVTSDFRGADLRGFDLRGQNLRNTDLSGADLRGADLRGANLSKVSGLESAILDGALLDEATLPSRDEDTRVTLRLSAEAARSVDKLMMMTGTTTRAEVIRQAIGLMDFFTSSTSRGGRILVEEPKGTVKEVILPQTRDRAKK